jgi:hypothetical protein
MPVAPLGASVRDIFAAQTDAARQDHYVFYELEWVGNSPALGPAGRLHLARVAAVLGKTKYPVLIEPHPDPVVNTARRLVVVSALTAAGVPDPDSRVVVGQPLAEGLYGEEAVFLYPAMLTTRFRNGLLGRAGLGSAGLGGLSTFGAFGQFGFGGGYGGYGGGYGGYGFFGGYGGYGGYGYGPYTTPATGYRGLGY